MRRALLLAAVLAALGAAPASAYQYFSQATGPSGVEPERWQSLPIKLTVDKGPTDISPEIATAIATWNNVPAARDPWDTVLGNAVDGFGFPIDYTGANFGTAWGDLSGDGNQEVVFDEDGTALTALGLDPATVNGFGARSETFANGHAAIDDMFLVVNGRRTDFDRQSTEVHELGHTLGLAHSSVGFSEGRDGALSPVLVSEEPTMFPYSVPGDARRTLEADDIAALSGLYPDPQAQGTTGTITGTVTRCDSGEPVLGANVRAINLANPTIQITRVTGFDGKDDGSYTIEGVPPGDYKVVVEPLAGDPDYLDRLAMYTRVDDDFTAEFLNQTKEGDCAQDDDPTAFEPIQVGATGTATGDFKVEGSSLALVIDRTGSMGPEIGAIKTGLETMLDGLEAGGASLPKTAIVTFDDHATVDVVSRDPARLRAALDAISLQSTPDCPEGSNSALMAAGRLLGTGGRAILVTDADSHRTGPSRQAVDDLFASKGARLTVLLSGSCPPEQNAPRAAARVAAAVATPTGPNDPGPDEDRPVDKLGVENAIRTFSEESLFSGGLFSFQPEIKSATAEAEEHYSDTLANVGISAVRPAVAAVAPSRLPQGTTLTVELTGSNTGFRAGSAVTVAGAGVSVTSTHVLSPSRMVVGLSVAPAATLGFRDVTVRTDRGDGSIESATGLGAVEVVAPPSAPAILSVVPSVGATGTTEDVTISGGLTHFAAGTSGADLGAGVTVNHLTVLSPTAAVANVTVQPGAAIGFRDVSVLTGAETAGESVPGPFLVTAPAPAVPRLTGAGPRSAARGTTVDVTLAGAGTAFEAGTSVASVSSTGVDVLSTTVTSPTRAVARLRIAPGAPLGFRDLHVTTGAEDAALLDGFEVTPAVRPPPTRTPTPTPTPTPRLRPPSTCQDTTSPRASFTGVSARHRKLVVHGRASDAGCLADISVAGRVAHVEVAISRPARGRRCRFVARSGRLTSARRCEKPVWLKARGTSRWTLQTKRRLPRGAYTLRARAVDATGNVQSRPGKRTVRVR